MNTGLLSTITKAGFLALTFLMSACGQVSLSITDAPIDTAEAVNLAITSVVFEEDGGDTTEVDLNPALNVDLMSLTDGVTELLVSSESLPQGGYKKVRLKLDVDASFVTVDGSQFSLTMPEDAESGLEVSKDFDVDSGDDINLVIDFDLRKSIRAQDQDNEYVLRPSMRLVIESETGSVRGSVGSSLLSSDSQCFDNTGAVTAVVYVFSGNDASVDDINGSSSDPLSSARVNADLAYTAAFLEEGDYTLALTCEALNDDPAVNDNLDFLQSHNVSVVESQSVTQDFNL